MQCQNCKTNTATIHLTEISGGDRKEMHICESCAAEQGIIVKSQIPINELLSGLLASTPSEDELSGSAETKLQCPRCGLTLEDFRKEAVLGCPYDYEIFEKPLSSLIENVQNGKTVHCGKVPSRAPADAKKQIELLNLKKQLEEAVKAENYELAAKLRDQIEQTEQSKQ